MIRPCLRIDTIASARTSGQPVQIPTVLTVTSGNTSQATSYTSEDARTASQERSRIVLASCPVRPATLESMSTHLEQTAALTAKTVESVSSRSRGQAIAPGALPDNSKDRKVSSRASNASQDQSQRCLKV